MVRLATGEIRRESQTAIGSQESKCFIKFLQTAKVMKWEIQSNNLPVALQKLGQAVATAVAFIFDLVALPFRASLFLSFGLCADQVTITKKIAPETNNNSRRISDSSSSSSESSESEFSKTLPSSSNDPSSYTSESESESFSLNSSSSSDATSSYASEWENDSSTSETPMLIPGNLQSHFKSESLEAPSFSTDDIKEELNVESTIVD